MQRTKKRKTSGFGQAVLKSLRGWQRGEPLTARQVAVIPEPHDWASADVKRLRTQTLGVSQSIFARLLGVSVKLVEAWESGRNAPAGPVRRLFDLIEQNPQEFLKQYVKGAA